MWTYIIIAITYYRNAVTNRCGSRVLCWLHWQFLFFRLNMNMHTMYRYYIYLYYIYTYLLYTTRKSLSQVSCHSLAQQNCFPCTESFSLALSRVVFLWNNFLKMEMTSQSRKKLIRFVWNFDTINLTKVPTFSPKPTHSKRDISCKIGTNTHTDTHTHTQR